MTRLANAFAKGASSGRKFAKIITDRFGENASTLAMFAEGPQPILADDPLLSLTSVIAAGDVTTKGSEALLSSPLGTAKYLALEKADFIVRLKKVDGHWKVLEFPSLVIAAEFTWEFADALDKTAAEVEHDKFRKVYEVWEVIRARRP